MLVRTRWSSSPESDGDLMEFELTKVFRGDTSVVSSIRETAFRHVESFLDLKGPRQCIRQS